MARTLQLDLPLLMPAQARKHVTVNEALASGSIRLAIHLTRPEPPRPV